MGPAYDEFCRLLGDVQAVEALLDVPREVVDQLALDDAVLAGAPEVDAANGGPAEEERPGDNDDGEDKAGDGAAEPERSAAEKSIEEAKKEQHRFRRHVRAWLQSNHAEADCVSYATMMFPHVKVMSRSLWYAGEDFDREQRLAGAEAKPDDAESEEELPERELNAHREFRLIVAYDGIVEEKFSNDLRPLLHDSAAFDLLPNHVRNLSWRNRVFIMGVRSGALNHKEHRRKQTTRING